MQAATLVCHLSTKGVRAFGRGLRRAAMRMEANPPQLATLAPRLSRNVNVEEPATVGYRALVPMSAEVVRDDTRDRHDALVWPGGVAPVIRDEDAYRSALRAHLANEAPYGPEVRRVVLVDYPNMPVVEQHVLCGRLSAIDRTVPDEMTRSAWRAAGVLGVEGPGVPRACQIEIA